VEIFLVGVVHGDPEGYEKVLRLLETIRPQAVSVEISAYSWNYRQRREVSWQGRFHQGLRSLPRRQREHPALRPVAAQLAMPFEVRAAAAYARQCGITWEAVDINAIAREHLPLYGKDLLSPKNLAYLASTPEADWKEAIRGQYQRARRAMDARGAGEKGLAVTAASPQATMREKVLARRIRSLAKKCRRVVHLGGWEHCLTGRPQKTMADFLTACRPRRLLLDDNETC